MKENEEKATVEVKKFPNYVIYIAIALFILSIGIGIFNIFNFNNGTNNKRVDTLTDVKLDEKLQFTIDGEEYTLGNTVKSYGEKFTYFKSFEELDSDSGIISTFYKNNKPYFLGFIYCASSSSCKYEDAKIIKMDFYNSSKIEINGKLDFYSNYDDFVEVLGEPTGKYYQDETMYVWSFGNKIGDSYLVASFDEGGLFSYGNLDKAKIGIWWYDDEFNDTVIKDK